MTAIEQVTDLLVEHGESFAKCPGCEICEKIKSFQHKITRDSSQRFNYILLKGPTMTTEELTLLIESKVERRLIINALGLKKEEFKVLIKNLRLTSDDLKERITEADKIFKKTKRLGALNMKDTYISLSKQGLSDTKTAKILGCSKETLLNYKSIWGLLKRK